MKKFQEIPGPGYLLCAILLLSMTSFGQSTHRHRHVATPQSSLSTSELEAQPTTTQYPGDPRRGGNSDPPTADQNAQPNPVQVPAYSQPQQQAPPVNQPGVMVPGSSARPQTPAASNMANGPVSSGAPSQVMIGPPAPPPPTPEHMPPTPAKVVYQNGLLSIESTNAQLTDILNAVHKKTGIQFEGLQLTSDRVAGQFGPAPANEVLINLLRGSRFDYVIIGTPGNPAQVQRVILTPNAAAGAMPAAPGPQPQPVNTGDDEENGEENQGDPQEQVQAPLPVRPPPVQQPQGNTGPRTQEQLLEELKAMQQQQQNQQQNSNQQNPPVRPPAPSRRPINPQ